MPETYKHKYAKEVFSKWIRQAIYKPNVKLLGNLDLELDYDRCKKNQFNSVYVEYPICLDLVNDNIVGCKSPDDQTLQHDWERWSRAADLKFASRSGIPNTKELKKLVDEKRLKMLHVFDIAIIDKGTLKYVVEIHHKHETKQHKIKWMIENNIKGWEIGADWVLERCKCPFKVEIEKTF